MNLRTAFSASPVQSIELLQRQAAALMRQTEPAAGSAL